MHRNAGTILPDRKVPVSLESNPFHPRRSLAEVYSKARNRYRPKKIRLVFVAESPPSSGGFFYFPETIGKDHLFRETMKALRLWPLSKPMKKGLNKRVLLEEFQSQGLFLIDTCRLPVDKLSDKERRVAIDREAPGLARRVEDLNPRGVIIVKKTIYAPVLDALVRVGLGDRVLNSRELPFPSHGKQTQYRKRLRRLMKRRILPK